MTEQQDFQSLDEMFRHSFENLPPTPAANGWDRPSDAVWTNIQQNIPPQNTGGWSILNTLAIGAAIVVLAVGAYTLLSPDKHAAQISAPVPAPSGVSPVTPPPAAAAPTNTAIGSPGTAVTPKSEKTGLHGTRGQSAKKQEVAATAPAAAAPSPLGADIQPAPARPSERASAQPLPGSKGERGRNTWELMWHTPAPVLPTVLEREAQRPKPAIRYDFIKGCIGN